MQTVKAVLLFLVVMTGVVAQGQQKSQIAAEVATRWLGYVDAQDYGKSYETSAPSLKQAMTKEQWEKQVMAMRGPLGGVVSRNQASASYTTEVPEMPAGEYVVVREQTSFERKKSAFETVIVSYEKDKWRVAGYSIK